MPQNPAGVNLVQGGSIVVHPATRLTFTGSVTITDLGNGNAQIEITGGGGGIIVNDGSTSVDPATTITFPLGSVTDAGGGEAEITFPSLTFIGNGGTVGAVTTVDGGTDITVSSGGTGIADLAIVGVDVAGLAGADPLDGSELVYVVQDGNDVQTTTGDIAALGGIAVDASFAAGIDPGNIPVFISNTAGTIVAIRARLEIASGDPATIQPVKAASGTAISAGTNLTTNTFDADGTPATNQTMTLSGTPADLVLAPGDCIGFVTTGTFTASTGGLTFFITP